MGERKRGTKLKSKGANLHCVILHRIGRIGGVVIRPKIACVDNVVKLIDNMDRRLKFKLALLTIGNLDIEMMGPS